MRTFQSKFCACTMASVVLALLLPSTAAGFANTPLSNSYGVADARNEDDKGKAEAFRNWRVLMTNDLSLGDFAKPGRPDTTGIQEFLIVERRGDLLMISDTIKTDPNGPDELDNFEPRFTIYGIFLYDSRAFGSSDKIPLGKTTFLLVRENPSGAPPYRHFFPVDGSATVGNIPNFRTLRAGGRHDSQFGPSSWQFDAVEIQGRRIEAGQIDPAGTSGVDEDNDGVTDEVTVKKLELNKFPK